MTAADGSRRFGPFGARCLKGYCTPGNLVGKDLMGFSDKSDWKYLGSAWKDGISGDTVCFNKGCPQSKYQPPEITTSPLRTLSGEAWVNDNFLKVNGSSDRFRVLNAAGQRIYASAVEGGKLEKMIEDGSAVSCSRFYAPELKLFNIELGLSPDAEVPPGWVQYPLDPPFDDPSGQYGYHWVRSDLFAAGQCTCETNVLWTTQTLESIGLWQPHSIKHSMNGSTVKVKGISSHQNRRDMNLL